MPVISVVIPVYNAEDCLPELTRRLMLHLESITTDFEIVYVEDCGRDHSWEVITAQAAQDPRIRGYKLSRNFGQHPAITAGLDLARGEWIIVMDCDLQDDPVYIPDLYQKAQDGFEIVLARRKQRKHSLPKRLSAGLFYFVFSHLAGYKYDGSVGTYRIMSARALAGFKLLREQLRTLTPLMNWMGFNTAYLEIEHQPRHAGRSSYNMRRLLRLAGETIIAFSDRPLRISVWLGFFIALCAFMFGVYTVLRAVIFGIPVAGWSSLIVSVYLLSGIIILNLGLIGMYLSRVYDETKGRPLYLIAAATESALPFDGTRAK
ncbi:MAG: glycosyltransferase family 2 protein [Candidatus Hydrogenedentes bacterium]|nr:glycosyltransferase family 2 protein [Candidatus Hydrogenedentota bacterium]